MGQVVNNMSILFPRRPKGIDILWTARRDMVGRPPVKSDIYNARHDEFVDDELQCQEMLAFIIPRTMKNVL